MGSPSGTTECHSLSKPPSFSLMLVEPKLPAVTATTARGGIGGIKMALSYFLLLNPNQCLPFKRVSHSFSRIQLFVTPWTVAHQAPLSMELSRQEYWSGLPFPPPGDLPDPGIEPMSPAMAGRFFTTEPPGKPFIISSAY